MKRIATLLISFFVFIQSTEAAPDVYEAQLLITGGDNITAIGMTPGTVIQGSVTIDREWPVTDINTQNQYEYDGALLAFTFLINNSLFQKREPASFDRFLVTNSGLDWVSMAADASGESINQYNPRSLILDFYADDGFALSSTDIPEIVLDDYNRTEVRIRYTAGPSIVDLEGEIELFDLVPSDIDNDQVPDSNDNCVAVANDAQIDTDNDGYGNACDGDFNNDCITNFLDFNSFAQEFLGNNPLFDLNNDGAVNFIDYTALTSMFLEEPGPGLTTGICE